MNWYKRQLKIAKRVWTDEELNKIKSLLEEGESIVQICRLLGTYPKEIKDLNKKYQLVDLEKVKRKKSEWIASLYLLPPKGKGLSTKEIKRQYDISRSSIVKALKTLGLEGKIRGRLDDYVNQQVSQKNKDFRKNNPGANEENSRRMLEWWKQFGSESGEKLKNRLLSYPTRQQAINQLEGFSSSLKNSVPYSGAIYNKFIQIINNHTFPDEVQQPQQQPQLV